MKLPKLPTRIWADYDAQNSPGNRWAFYVTKSEQRSNRPDLKPIKLRVTRAK